MFSPSQQIVSHARTFSWGEPILSKTKQKTGYTRVIFYVRRAVDFLKTAKVNSQRVKVHMKRYFVCLFDLILYTPSTIFQLCRDGSSWIEPILI